MSGILLGTKAPPPGHVRVTVECIGCNGQTTDAAQKLFDLGWLKMVKSVDRLRGRTHHAWCPVCVKQFRVVEDNQGP